MPKLYLPQFTDKETDDSWDIFIMKKQFWAGF